MDIVQGNGGSSKKLGECEMLVGDDGTCCKKQLLLLHEDVGDRTFCMRVDAPFVSTEPRCLSELKYVLCSLWWSEVEMIVDGCVVEGVLEDSPVEKWAVDMIRGSRMISAVDDKGFKCTTKKLDVVMGNPSM